MSAFDAAFRVTVGHEGGYVNNKDDPGGETNFGISKRAYPNVDIKGLTLEKAKAIYLTDYWSRTGCDKMAPALALLVFDAAVNNGVGSAARWLQLAVGVTPDGKIGPGTLSAITKADPQKAAVEFMAQRINAMANLPTWKTFGLGWARRLARLPYEAQSM
jgi:lysozyme family protein